MRMHIDCYTKDDVNVSLECPTERSLEINFLMSIEDAKGLIEKLQQVVAVAPTMQFTRAALDGIEEDNDLD
jgi:hypothetical protein